MHTKEKEKLGTCCQIKDEQENAEQQTYEYSVPTMSIHELAKTNPTLTYRQVEQLKEANYESSEWYLGKHNNKIGTMRQKQLKIR